jgi:hypothetical protein
MDIIINTDHYIKGSEMFYEKLKLLVHHSLDRAGENIIRLNLHLSDENGAKMSKKNQEADKRCMIEMHYRGRNPIAITHHALTVDTAVSGALEKIKRKLISTNKKYKN